MMAAARNGDLDAWYRIVREHQEPVFRSAYLATRDRVLAEETAKAAFVRAYRSLSTLREGDDVRPWIMRLADAIARARLREQAQRRDGRAVETASSPCLPAAAYHLAAGAPTPTPHESMALADAFDGLPDNQRAVIAARYAFGLGREAAATRLDAEPAAVDGLLASAIARLRTRADRPLPGDGVATRDPKAGRLPLGASRFGSLSDDQLGSLTMATVMAELPWTPDVARAVCDRLAREAVAYGVTAPVPDRTSTHRAARPASHEPTARGSGSRPFSASRAFGLVAGASLLVAVFVFAGGTGQHGAALLADARSSVDGLLGGTSAPPAIAATDTAATARAVPAGQSVTPSPAAVTAKLPLASLVGTRRFEEGSLRAQVRLEWAPETEENAPVLARLERLGDDGTWSPLAWTDSREPLLVELHPGTTYGLRVRSVDAADAATVSPVSRLKLKVLTARSDRLVRSKGGWKRRLGPTGQPQLVAVESGARVGTRFSGTDVAVLGRLAPSLDPIGLRVDDGPWERDSEPIARSGRTVLYRQDLDAGAHSLEVRAYAEGLALDAFLILRSVSA
jgi:RNA polymerase sigma factor (sigma-70 family)